MVCLYAIYDSARGVVVGGAATAIRNARTVAGIERSLHVFVEPSIQAALTHVPGLVTLFGFGYATFHLGVTGAVLLWLYYRRPGVFARVRTLLVVTTLLALIGFAFFPVAPPRLAGVGIADTLNIGRATVESGVLHWLYNPYAAVPSLHMAFAVIAGGSVVAFARHRAVRLVGLGYPVFVAAEVLATGNHFLFDVVTGVAVVAVAAVLTLRLRHETVGPTLARCPATCWPQGDGSRISALSLTRPEEAASAPT